MLAQRMVKLDPIRLSQ